MATTDDWRRPIGDDSEALEEAIRRFEAAWRRNESPSIVQSLVGAGPLRTRLLEELLHIDLEFRLKAGESARAEDYRRDFPEVRADPSLLLALIRTEATIRRRAEPGLRLGHYRARFAEFNGDLERTLEGLGLPGDLPPDARSDGPARTEPTRSGPGGPTLGRLGKFELRQRLGSGEFGTVFRAWDTVLKREVAVKVPRPEVMKSPPDLLIFLREARNAIHLKHSSIVAIYDAGPIEGTACVVREFIAGMTLAERIRSRPLDIPESVALVAAVLDGLAYAHRHGIIHRDLKPSNILLDEDGRPHLTDFGLAKRSTGDSTISPAGVDRVLIGTPAYMPPEQARGDAHSVDERSDIYSVGVVLYELLTGGVPFRGRGRLLQAQIEHASPIPPSDLDESIPPALESVCLRAMAKHPDQRYPSAHEMAHDLANFVAGRPVVGLGPAPDPAPRGAPRRRRILLAVGLSLLPLGLLAVGAWGVAERHRQHDARLRVALIDGLEALDATVLDPAALGPEASQDRRLQVEAVQHRLESIVPFLSDHPELAARRVDLLVRHAERTTASGDDGLARQAWRQAVAALEPCVAGPSATPRRREELARGLMTLARIDAEGGRIDRAKRLAERAAALWDGLADERQAHPGTSDIRRAALISRTKALLEADRADRLAERDPRPARIEEVERVARSPRDDEGWSLDELRGLVEVEQGLASRALEIDEPAEAVRWAGAALDLVEASANRAGAAARDQLARATALLGLAEASGASETSIEFPAPRAASERLQLAAIRLLAALERNPGDLAHRRDRIAVERGLGRLQLDAGSPGRADETLRRAQSWNRALLVEGWRHQDLAQCARIDADLALVAFETRRRIPACVRMARAAFRMGQAERLAPGLASYGGLVRVYVWATVRLLVGCRPGEIDRPFGPTRSITAGSGTSRGDRTAPRRTLGPPAPAPMYRMSPFLGRSTLGSGGMGLHRGNRP